MALLLNACPDIYRWLRYNRWSYFLTGISIIACVTAAHHVTTIFGMVFFVAPVLGTAVLDRCAAVQGGIHKVRLSHFIQTAIKHLPQLIFFGVLVIMITVTVLFPYWYWSKTDPITQVSIPHGSRASFIDVPDLGIVFFLIPWGMMLFFLPYLFINIYRKRMLFLGLSFTLLFLLGTGGTTPLPQLILGETAFNILTLDRFTFWASIIALPFMGQLFYELFQGQLKEIITRKFGPRLHMVVSVIVVSMVILTAASVINFSNFKTLQPDEIDVVPIANFLERDGHDRWRYMTLGFGDQMAWLSANTTAHSLDGNYHSARRLPELTSRAVERIENSKYLGESGLKALRDFLSLPEKYQLKYVFSNDKFYEPLLYFYGWEKLTPLENKIDVWERKDVPPLPTILRKLEIPLIQRLMWGILPLSCLVFAVFINVSFWFVRRLEPKVSIVHEEAVQETITVTLMTGWFFTMLALGIYLTHTVFFTNHSYDNCEEIVHAYYHALDYKEYDQAFEFIDVSQGYTLEQFYLENSLEDGILASYSKLDTVQIINKEQISEEEQILTVKAQWFTAVQKYSTEQRLRFKSIAGDWKIIKATYEKSTPPEQLLNIHDISYHDQGRRKAIVGATDREDILDRPEVYINQANLVRHNGYYYVVGEIQNIDNVPSFVTIEAVLYDKAGTEIYRASADEVLCHNLMPKERSGFRIDFDQWETRPDTLTDQMIESFVVFARSMVTDEQLYKFHGYNRLQVSTSSLTGMLDNYGNKQISIPQLITTQKKQNEIIWAESTYLNKGIRPQRTKPFTIDIKQTDRILLKRKGSDQNILINGTLLSEIKRLLPEQYKANELNIPLAPGHTISVTCNAMVI